MPDQTHDLGLLAFPLLPKQLTTDTTMNIMRTMTDDTLTIEIDPDDESSTIDAELRLSVRESINKLSIPSLRHTRIAATLMVFIFVCVTVIAMTYLIPVKIDEISTPLEYMYQSATFIKSSGTPSIMLAKMRKASHFPTVKQAPPKTSFPLIRLLNQALLMLIMKRFVSKALTNILAMV